MRHAAIAITTLGLILLGPGGARADGAPQPKGDAKAGKAVAAACTVCHGDDGLSRKPGIPRLAGQHAHYLVDALRAYKKSEREDPSMQAIMEDLEDTQIIDVAAYYAEMAPFNRTARDGTTPIPEEDPFAEVREATADCAGCHGDDGNVDEPGMPGLAGQTVIYLITAMQAYRDGTRDEPTMQAFAEPLSNAEIEDMAYFYAAMTPRRAETPAPGDAIAGLSATASCGGCHGLDGNSKDPKTPRLAGLDAEYLAISTMAYKEGSREHAVMQEAVIAMREVDIRNMAAFYASKEPKALPVRKPLTVAEWVKRCDRCHGPDGNSVDPRFPILAGQDKAYLAKTLKLYHGGDRPSSTMQAMSFLMGESDIERLATYYAAQRAN